MASAFDSYYKWLGIPPTEQPPNHYRLLGISLFESDLDVIEAAADQRMIHLRSFQTGQHSELSQKLLNEVAAAKLCLLKADRRANYDVALRQQLALKSIGSGPPFAGPPPLPSAGMQMTPAAVIADFSASDSPAAIAQPVAQAPDSQSDWGGDPLDFSSARKGYTRPAVAPRSKSAMPIVVMIAAPILGLLVVIAAIKVFNDREEAADDASRPAAGRNREAGAGGDAEAPVSARPALPMLVVDWPKEARTGGFLILDGTTFDVSQVTGPLEYKLTPGAHKLGLRRPGMAPIDLAVPPQQDGQRFAYRPKWQIASPADDAASVASVDRRFIPSPPPDQHPEKISAEKSPSEKNTATDEKPQPVPVATDATPKPAEPARAAIPDPAAQQKATAQMKDVLKDEFTQAKTPEAQIALARHLGKLAEEDFATDPAVSYVMAKEALDLAAKHCEPALASELVGGFSNHFDVDTWDLKATTLNRLAHNAKTPDARGSLANGVIQLVDKAIADERYEVAAELGTTASYLASQLKELALKDVVKELNDRVRRIQKAAQEGEAASQTLSVQPDDPNANLAVGKFKCFLKDDWKFGLPLLLKGNDDALKDLARQDSAAPTESADRMKLADAWWDLADKRAADKSETGKRDDWTIKPMRGRAAYWYEKALPSLSGLALTKAQKRVDEAEPSRAESAGLEAAFLDDLPEQAASVGVGRLGKHGDAGYAAPRIKVRGAQPPHALSMQLPANGSSTVSYALDHKWKSFSGIAAITDDSKDVLGTLTFKVYGDGKLLWSSRPLRGRAIPRMQPADYQRAGAEAGSNMHWTEQRGPRRVGESGAHEVSDGLGARVRCRISADRMVNVPRSVSFRNMSSVPLFRTRSVRVP